MSIFSRLAKNLKRGLRKIAPIIAPAISLIVPGIGGIIGSAVLGGVGGGATPGIVPPQARTRVLPGGGRTLTIPPFAQGSGRTEMSLFGALPAIRAAPSIIRGGAQAVGRFIGSPAGRLAIGSTAAIELARTVAGGGGGACPSGWHLNKQDGVGGPAGTYCVRNRRMNFGNARSARRSVRRLKGARKLLKDIEKMMPRAPARRPAAAAHHHHPRGGVV